MAALLALEFRLLWRVCRAKFWYSGYFILLIVMGIISKRNVPMATVGSWVLLPGFFFTISGMVSIMRAETLAWLVPLKIPARLHARMALVSMLGLLHGAVCLALFPLTKNTPIEGWPALALHLWLCFAVSCFLLFAFADLTRNQHSIIQTLAFVIGISPGYGMSIAHMVSGAPPWTFAAEAGFLGLLLAWNLHFHRDMEPARGVRSTDVSDLPRPVAPALAQFQVVASALVPLQRRAAPAPLPTPASPRLDHVADPGPVLFGSLFSYVSVWLCIGAWLLVSFIPFSGLYFILGYACFGSLLTRALRTWAPFQWTPIPRSVVLRRLFCPILVFWALTLAIQCATLWYERPTVLNHSADGFSLPIVKRECEEFLPPQFDPNLLRPGREMPKSPAAIASLMSQALRVSYGLDVPAEDILAIRPPESPDRNPDENRAVWLHDVERRWQTPIRMMLLQWRIVAGLLLLLFTLTTLAPVFPGRLPRWMLRVAPWIIVPAGWVPMFLFIDQKFNPRLPAGLRALYSGIFDRPWILVALLLVASGLLLRRHAREFCVSSPDLSQFKQRRGFAGWT